MNDQFVSDDARKLAAIAGLQREVDAAESAYEQAKDEAASLKKIFEQKARALFEYNRALNAPLPLFEVWRNTPVSEIGLPDGITAVLQEQGLDTVGKIADWTQAGKLLTDIAHIGQNKAEAIKDALERFWREHRSEDEAPQA